MKRLLCCILTLSSSLTLFGQHAKKPVSIYLVPETGVEFLLSSFADKSEAPDYVSRITTYPADRYGLGLKIKFQEVWHLETGWNYGGIGQAIRLKSSAFISNEGNYLPVSRVFVQIGKHLKEIRIRKSPKSIFNNLPFLRKKHYLSIFSIQGILGLTYDHLYNADTGFFSINYSSGGNSYQFTENIQESEILKKHGWSIYTGFFIQFLNSGKERLRFAFIYQQGLQQRLFTEWTMGLGNSTPNSFQTISRGSMFAISVSYPIRLITFGKEEASLPTP